MMSVSAQHRRSQHPIKEDCRGPARTPLPVLPLLHKLAFPLLTCLHLSVSGTCFLLPLSPWSKGKPSLLKAVASPLLVASHLCLALASPLEYVSLGGKWTLNE